MAVLKIARMGHPALMRPAEPVKDPTSADIRRLIDDMIDTMHDALGIGLAAPQVHIPLRIVVYYVPETRTADGAGHPLTVLINPEIEVLDADVEIGTEACLSLPGMAGNVPRPREVRVRALAFGGEQLDYIASGYHARVVQHECDHLDGVLYPMRMTDLSTLGYVEELAKAE